ncbi:Hypothetical_protein [Hexamita inflata]|uniref:Hypothetical_protein n=1 Tax=Hexamita inflata TaxID=28002 RepID=A0ABP1HPP3_9EUKA
MNKRSSCCADMESDNNMKVFQVFYYKIYLTISKDNFLRDNKLFVIPFNFANFQSPREQSICASSFYLAKIQKPVKSVFSDLENLLVSKISTIFQTSALARIFLKVITRSKLYCSRNLQTSKFQKLSSHQLIVSFQKFKSINARNQSIESILFAYNDLQSFFYLCSTLKMSLSRSQRENELYMVNQIKIARLEAVVGSQCRLSSINRAQPFAIVGNFARNCEMRCSIIAKFHILFVLLLVSLHSFTFLILIPDLIRNQYLFLNQQLGYLKIN